MIVGSTKNSSEASFEAVDPADLTPLTELVDKIMLWIAMTTDTPAGRFNSTKAIASKDTLKEQQEPLDAKVELRQTLIGDAWEDCMYVARRLENTFGKGGLDETVTLSTQWVTRHSLEELKAKQELGVPKETLWAEAGYSQEQIAAMKETDDYQARQTMIQASLGARSEGG
jgi:hypothetical protein